MIATGKTQKNIEDIYPLSQNQSSFLFGHIRAQTNDPGKVQVRCRLEGKMDKALFEASWRWTVARHPVLRSSIHWNNLAQPVQVVHQHVDIQIDFGEYLEVDAEQRQSRIEDYVDAERGAWLALDKPPLFRLGVLSFTDNTHLLCWTCHHILIDGWSVGIVLGDVIKHYQSSLEHVAYDPPQPRKYHDYVSWLAEQDYAEARKLWRAWFSVKPMMRTAGRAQRIAGDTDTEASRSVSMRLDPQTYGNLKRMVSEQRSTMGLVVQALWAALLHLLSRNEQVEFSIAVSGRAVDLPGVDTMIGQFASTLPVVLSVNPRQTFSELLGQMSTCAGQLRRFEHVTPTKIQEWGLTPMGTKVLAGAGGRYVDSVVVIENFPWRATDHVEHESSLRLLSLDGDLASHFDLTLAVIEDSDLTLRLDSRH